MTNQITRFASTPPPQLPADRSWALFLDLDGTLIDSADAPASAQVPDTLIDDLAHLYEHSGGAVAVVSGRSLEQLDKLLRWQGRPAVGQHGAEIRFPDGRMQLTGSAERINHLACRAEALVDALPDVWLENKHQVLAVHFHDSAASRAAAQDVAARLLQQAGSDYVLQQGEFVVELKPAAVNKGRAITRLLASPQMTGRRPWVMGDERSDEDAFRTVNKRNGVSIIIGDRQPTQAHYRLPDPAATRAWLHEFSRLILAGAEDEASLKLGCDQALQ